MTKLFLKLMVAVITFLVGAGIVALWLRSHSWLHFSPSVQIESRNQPEDAEKTEEYAVYSAVIRKMFVEDGIKSLAIQNRTLTYGNPDDLKSTTAEERIRDMKSYCQSVDESAIRAFQAKYMLPKELTPNFDRPPSYVLVDMHSLNETSEWTIGYVLERFYKKYPDVRGLISFSRVGFNTDCTRAFLRVELIFCPLCGSGENVLLKKEKGIWIVADRFSGWVP